MANAQGAPTAGYAGQRMIRFQGGTKQAAQIASHYPT